MAKKIYVAELDAHTARLETKIDNIKNRIVAAGTKMEAAFKRVGGAMIAAFSAYRVVGFIKDLVEIGNKVVNVRNAFDRLNNPNLLSNLRKATKGTIDDLTLMQSANFANKMRIPGDLLAKGMEFAGLVALETGQDIQYMMESFVTGTARESVKILDNLGISAKELAEEIKKVGNFQVAVGNIMDRELKKMREGLDETVLTTKRLNVQLENQKIIVGEKLAGAWNLFLGGLALQINQNLEGWDRMDTWLKEVNADLEIFLGLRDRLETKQPLSGVSFGLRSDRLALESKMKLTPIPWLKQQQDRLKEINETINEGNLSASEYKVLLKEQASIQDKLRLPTEKEITSEMIKQYDIMEDIYTSMKRMDDELVILGDFTPYGKLLKKGGKKEVYEPKWDDAYKHLELATGPMTTLSNLSSQIMSTLSIGSQTFLANLTSALSVGSGIVNIISGIVSVISFLTGGGIVGAVKALEKGGRVSNKFGKVTLAPIPSFAGGGSYSTPAWSGPMAGGYPVMVHRNETLDVYNSGQTSKMENKMDRLINAVLTSNIHLSKRGGRSIVIPVVIDGKQLFRVVASLDNRAGRSGVNKKDFI